MAEVIIITALVAGLAALIIAIVALFLALRASALSGGGRPSVRNSSAGAYLAELKKQQAEKIGEAGSEPAKTVAAQSAAPKAEDTVRMDAIGCEERPAVLTGQEPSVTGDGEVAIQSGTTTTAAAPINNPVPPHHPAVTATSVSVQIPVATRNPDPVQSTGIVAQPDTARITESFLRSQEFTAPVIAARSDDVVRASTVSLVSRTDISSLAQTSADSVVAESLRLREATQLLPDEGSTRSLETGVAGIGRELVTQSQSLGKEPNSDYLEMMIVRPERAETSSDTLQSLVGMSEFFKEADFPVETRKLMGIDGR